MYFHRLNDSFMSKVENFHSSCETRKPETPLVPSLPSLHSAAAMTFRLPRKLEILTESALQEENYFYQRFSSFLSSSRYFLELQYFVLFYLFAFLHVIVLLEIIITFYAFNNFPFPAISRISPNMNSSRFSLSLPLRSRFGGNAKEMKILRKINFFMQIFPILTWRWGKRFCFCFGLRNDAIRRVDLNILLI